MKYIKITNKGSANRLLLEILGFGTKQSRLDDKLVVGQFHSGFKLATPASLRAGLKVVVTSYDDIASGAGSSKPYILQFETKKIQIAHQKTIVTDEQIRYKYSDGRMVDATVALSAFPEWGKPIGDDKNPLYSILREYISNARDEDKNPSIEFDVSSIVEAKRDTTSIYIEQRPEIKKIFKEYPDRYFKFLGAEPVYIDPHIGAIYPKSELQMMRFFSDGYLVGCEEEKEYRMSMYDYDAFGKDMVNELRQIKQDYKYLERLAVLFSTIKDKKLIYQLLVYAILNKNSYECQIFGNIRKEMMSDKFREICITFWNEYFDNITFVPMFNQFDKLICELSYKIATVNTDLALFFREVGIPTSQEKYNELVGGLKYREFTEKEKKRYEFLCNRYLRKVRYFNDLLEKFKAGTVEDPRKQNYGMTNKDWDGYFIEKDRLLSEDDYKPLKTIIHELRHCETRFRDNTREFTSSADATIVFLLCLLGDVLDKLEQLGIDIEKEFPNHFVKLKPRT